MEVNTEREGVTIIASLSGRVEGGTTAAQFQEDLQAIAAQAPRRWCWTVGNSPTSAARDSGQ